MIKKITRRKFISRSSSVIGGGILGRKILKEQIQVPNTHKGPYDFMIVEGHRDI